MGFLLIKNHQSSPPPSSIELQRECSLPKVKRPAEENELRMFGLMDPRSRTHDGYTEAISLRLP